MAKTRLITRRVVNASPSNSALTRDVDRHGNERFYLRLPGMPKYRMTSVYLDRLAA